jgi:hypothetical protein
LSSIGRKYGRNCTNGVWNANTNSDTDSYAYAGLAFAYNHAKCHSNTVSHTHYNAKHYYDPYTNHTNHNNSSK